MYSNYEYALPTVDTSGPLTRHGGSGPRATTASAAGRPDGAADGPPTSRVRPAPTPPKAAQGAHPPP
ncbi:hypothetical protein ACFXA1_37240, partial [Streptomyces sviceus]